MKTDGRLGRLSALYGDLIPKYSRIPLLSVLLFNMLVYFLSKPFLGERFFDLSIGLDTQIPFCAPFVIFYVLAYLQWGLGYIIVGRESRAACYRMVAADLIAKTVCLVFFIAMPTTIVRPELTEGGVFEWMTGLIYDMDSPVNLFPSIHCLESWAVFRCALPLKKIGLWYKITTGVITVGVFFSVVFLKQHFLIDIPAGILVFELGLLVTRFTRFDSLIDSFMRRINR